MSVKTLRFLQTDRQVIIHLFRNLRSVCCVHFVSVLLRCYKKIGEDYFLRRVLFVIDHFSGQESSLVELPPVSLFGVYSPNISHFILVG